MARQISLVTASSVGNDPRVLVDFRITLFRLLIAFVAGVQIPEPMLGPDSWVIAIDIYDEELALAREFGATDTINATANDPVEAVRDLTSGGIAWSFEALGRKQTAEQTCHMRAPGGTATVIGMVPDGQKLEIDAAPLIYDRKLQGSNMGSSRFRVDMPRYPDDDSAPVGCESACKIDPLRWVMSE